MLYFVCYCRKKSSKLPRFRLWTFPVLIRGPFGVVSATEFVGIVLFLLYVFWATYAYSVQALGMISESDLSSFREKRYNSLVPSFIFCIWVLQTEFFSEMINASTTLLLAEIDLKSLKFVCFASYLIILGFGSFK